MSSSNSVPQEVSDSLLSTTTFLTDIQPSPSFSSSQQPTDLNLNLNLNLNPPLLQLNLRSCKTCRRRKVRCNKQDPCSNCIRASIPCIFPDSSEIIIRRVPGKRYISDVDISTTAVTPKRLFQSSSSQPGIMELSKRLGDLEAVVRKMGISLDGGDYSRLPYEISGLPPDQGQRINMIVPGDTGTVNNKTPEGWESLNDITFENLMMQTDHNKPGSLLVQDGRSVYVNDSFWANVADEVQDLRGLLDDVSADEDQIMVQKQSSTSSIFCLMNPSPTSDLLLETTRSLFPLPSQIPFYWQIFTENIDPLVKLLHRPTIYKTMVRAKFRFDLLSKSLQALVFAISLAAVQSLTPDEVNISLGGEEKSACVEKYRQGVERSLARADFLASHDIATLQAFILYLFCIKGNDDKGYVRTLTGLAITVAQHMGLHRDGSDFHLSPYETEIRRRIWWQLQNMDICESISLGADPKITEGSFNTKLPLNINDEDFDPNTTGPLQIRTGVTDMMFCLVKHEMCTTMRRLCYVPPGGLDKQNLNISSATLHEKEEMIRKCQRHLETTYLQHFSQDNNRDPMSWSTRMIVQLITARMWLILYHPYVTTFTRTRHTSRNPSVPLSTETKDKIMLSSVEALESLNLLKTSTSSLKWHWLFKTYAQWHGIAIILSRLCYDDGPRHGSSLLADRSWKVIEESFDMKDKDAEGDTGTGTGTGSIESDNRLQWRIMRKLKDRAGAARAAREENRMTMVMVGEEHHHAETRTGTGTSFLLFNKDQDQQQQQQQSTDSTFSWIGKKKNVDQSVLPAVVMTKDNELEEEMYHQRLITTTTTTTDAAQQSEDDSNFHQSRSKSRFQFQDGVRNPDPLEEDFDWSQWNNEVRGDFQIQSVMDFEGDGNDDVVAGAGAGDCW